MKPTEPAALGRGRIATVYPWGQGLAGKVFQADPDEPWIAREAECTRLAQQCGLPVPAIRDVTVREGKPVIVMDRIEGGTLTSCLMRESVSVSEEGAKIAELHHKIHSCRAPSGFPGMTGWIEWRIRRAPDIDSDGRDRLLTLLSSQETGDRICHNDFHPDNILRGKDRDYVIDWCDATCGNPWADVARTVLVFESRSLPPDMPPEAGQAVNAVRDAIGAAYIRRYQELAGVESMPIRAWRVLIAASRLWLALEGEDEHNRSIVRGFLESGTV
jgi:aminoglycoside phosphotransferase (APT) family kinase protein